jgi:hypothetical protein
MDGPSNHNEKLLLMAMSGPKMQPKIIANVIKWTQRWPLKEVADSIE